MLFLKAVHLYTGCIKKLNKPEIALRLCKAPQYTKFFVEIGCYQVLLGSELTHENKIHQEPLKN